MTSRRDFHRILFCQPGYSTVMKVSLLSNEDDGMENLASDKQVTVKKKISGKNDTTCSSFRDEVFIKVNGTSIQSELYIIFCLLQYCKY